MNTSFASSHHPSKEIESMEAFEAGVSKRADSYSKED